MDGLIARRRVDMAWRKGTFWVVALALWIFQPLTSYGNEKLPPLKLDKGARGFEIPSDYRERTRSFLETLHDLYCAVDDEEPTDLLFKEANQQFVALQDAVREQREEKWKKRKKSSSQTRKLTKEERDSLKELMKLFSPRDTQVHNYTHNQIRICPALGPNDSLPTLLCVTRHVGQYGNRESPSDSYVVFDDDKNMVFVGSIFNNRVGKYRNWYPASLEIDRDTLRGRYTAIENLQLLFPSFVIK